MIIILASGRSGSTWLAKLFDSHPDVVYRHEPDVVDVQPAIPFLPTNDQIASHLQLASSYLRRLSRNRSARSVGHRPFFRKSYRGFAAQQLFVASVLALKAVENTICPRSLRHRLRIPKKLDAPASDRVQVVIKSVSSLGRARLFAEAQPHARIVHVRRHPCGVVASRLRGVSKGLLEDRMYLEATLGMKEAKYYPFHPIQTRAWTKEECMAYQWMVHNDKVICDMRANTRYRLVSYEALCRNPKEVATELFQFVGLGWSAQTEGFLERIELRGDSPGYFSVMRSPAGAAHRWRQELSSQQIDRILSICAHSRANVAFD